MHHVQHVNNYDHRSEFIRAYCLCDETQVEGETGILTKDHDVKDS